MASLKATETLIFDIDPGIENAERAIPFVLRVCKNKCANPSEYLGWNIWGYAFEKRSTYCQCCGYALHDLASVTLAIQGDKVIQCNFRSAREVNLTMEMNELEKSPTEEPGCTKHEPHTPPA